MITVGKEHRDNLTSMSFRLQIPCGVASDKVRLEKVANDTLKFTGDQWIGKKVVDAEIDSFEELGPLACRRDHNQRKGTSSCILLEEHVLVLAVGKSVLADDEPEVIPSDIRSGMFDGRGEDGRDAAEQEDFAESLR